MYIFSSYPCSGSGLHYFKRLQVSFWCVPGKRRTEQALRNQRTHSVLWRDWLCVNSFFQEPERSPGLGCSSRAVITRGEISWYDYPKVLLLRHHFERIAAFAWSASFQTMYSTFLDVVGHVVVFTPGLSLFNKSICVSFALIDDFEVISIAIRWVFINGSGKVVNVGKDEKRIHWSRS